MATTIDTSSNPLAAYGYDAATGQQLAQSLGITTQQLAAAFAQTPMTGGSNPTTTSYGMTTGGQPAGRDLQATVQQLQVAKAAGMGAGGAGQAGAAGLPTGAVDYSGGRAAENLGAAALGAVGFSGAEGAFPVYNPVPGQINSPKGGIQTNVPSPMVANAIPNVQTPNVASVFGQQTPQSQGLAEWSRLGGGSAADAASIEKAQGWAPGTIGQKFYESGVQQGTIQPGGNNPAPTSGGTPTAVMPANAPGAAGQVASPFAVAPPAPGASVPAQAAMSAGGAPAAPTQGGGQWGAMAAHTAGLEDAGKAIFQHMTGNDPSTASHADIMGFHNQLNSMIGGMGAAGAAPAGAANYTAGVNQPPNTSPPPKMATGGMVPGRGNQDTVPALLTPGEYVIPKQQAAQIFGGRAPIRMQEGGFVPDDEKKKTPPEVSHQRIAPPGSPPPAPSQTTPSGQSTQGSSQDSSQGQQPQQGYWSNMVNQAQAAQAANIGSGGPGSLDSLGSLGDEGLANQAIQGTGANTAAAGADIAGGLISGLQQAWDKYAKSIKPWQMEAQQFGKGGTPNYQDVNFQQDTTV